MAGHDTRGAVHVPSLAVEIPRVARVWSNRFPQPTPASAGNDVLAAGEVRDGSIRLRQAQPSSDRGHALGVCG
jgi:hypothetical protein